MGTEHPPDLTLYAIPLFFVLMVAELLVLRRRRRRIDRRDFWASLGMGLGSLLTINLVMGIVGWWFANLLWPYRAFDLGDGVLGWTVAIIGWDLIYYWDHRISHETRFFWASHVNHHSSLEFNLSTALRQPWTAFQTAFFVGFLALVGVSPALIVMSGAINLIYQYWIHTEVVGCIGPFERILNSASHHRVHHGSNPQYLDKNYGGIFIVWDRLFGTYEPEVEPVRYGLTKDIHSYNLLTIAFHEWRALGRDVRATRGWRDRARRLYKGPGWEPQPAPELQAVS
ncbi:MAG TPA: sterol desaturase family protein [Acidimicrobiales bacterium]|nr:sterol desaturase family protein [Acidimicrobiales bacterium]